MVFVYEKLYETSVFAVFLSFVQFYSHDGHLLDDGKLNTVVNARNQ